MFASYEFPSSNVTPPIVISILRYDYFRAHYRRICTACGGLTILLIMTTPIIYIPPPATLSPSISLVSPPNIHPPLTTPISLCTNVDKHIPQLPNKTLTLNKLIKPNKKKLAKSHNLHKNSIDLEYGNRTLNIASLNPDSLRTKEAKTTLISTINALRIDIACIQETHNERIDSEQIDNYTIFYGGCDCTKLSKNHNANDNTPIDESILGPNAYKAGVAMVIRNDLTHLIINIYRISSRIMELRIQTGKNCQSFNLKHLCPPKQLS